MVDCDNSSNGPNKYWKLIAKNNNFIPLDLPNKKLRKLWKKRKNFLVILVISIIMVMKYLLRLYLNN